MAATPLVVGHRGWRDKYPENTLVSFRAALDLGVDALEFDLHLSRDGHVVVIHDDTLDRTTDAKGPVQARTLAELKRLDAGGWLDPRFAGERVPTLEEALDLVPPSVLLYAEVKDYRPEMVEKLVPLVVPRAASLVVHSFGIGFLEAFGAAAPGVRIGLLGNVNKLDMGAEARRLGCWGIHPCMEALTREQVAAWHAEGFTVMCWTVRDEADARRALDLSPYAIGADCPDLLLRLLGRA
jgi:glycerophosphoryl diester phosphodiesterase